MARNRITFPKTALAKMQRMMKAGATALQIAKALAGDDVEASAATVGRWMREQRGARRATKLAVRARGAKAASSPAEPRPTPATEEPPSDNKARTPKERLDLLIARAEKHLAIAETEQNAAALSSLMRVQVGLLKEIRMVARETPPDPSEAPDFVAAAKRARERLHKYVDVAAKKQASAAP